MNIANLLAAHGIGSGGFQKNSFVPLENAGVFSELYAFFQMGTSDLESGLTMDNATNVYAIDNKKILKKFSRTGTSLLSATLPSPMNTSANGNIRMEYCPALDRIVVLDTKNLVVMDASLNVLYNQPFPDQPARTGYLIFIIRGKFLYHVMAQGYNAGYRVQKFDLSTLTYVFDNFGSGSFASNTRFGSTLEVDDQDNFYIMGAGPVFKIDKTGMQIWSTVGGISEYLYYDKADSKLYFVEQSGKVGYIDVSTGARTYANSTNPDGIFYLYGLGYGSRVYDSGMALMKRQSGSGGYFNTLMTVYKNSVMFTELNVVNNSNYPSQNYNLLSAATRKGYTVVLNQNSFHVTIFRTGVKIL